MDCSLRYFGGRIQYSSTASSFSVVGARTQVEFAAAWRDHSDFKMGFTWLEHPLALDITPRIGSVQPTQTGLSAVNPKEIRIIRVGLADEEHYLRSSRILHAVHCRGVKSGIIGIAPRPSTWQYKTIVNVAITLEHSLALNKGRIIHCSDWVYVLSPNEKKPYN